MSQINSMSGVCWYRLNMISFSCISAEFTLWSISVYILFIAEDSVSYRLRHTSYFKHSAHAPRHLTFSKNSNREETRPLKNCSLIQIPSHSCWLKWQKSSPLSILPWRILTSSVNAHDAVSCNTFTVTWSTLVITALSCWSRSDQNCLV